MKVDSEIADVIWDILVRDCKAREDHRSDFVRYAIQADDLHHRGIIPEYRFQGCFGFGGKIYLARYGWNVDFYTEDWTPERDTIRETVNDKLHTLYERQKTKNEITTKS